jgi:uncharacterized membrane protein
LIISGVYLSPRERTARGGMLLLVLDAWAGRGVNGVFTSLDVPGAETTSANGINARGDIIGAYWLASGWHGFLLTR